MKIKYTTQLKTNIVVTESSSFINIINNRKPITLNNKYQQPNILDKTREQQTDSNRQHTTITAAKTNLT